MSRSRLQDQKLLISLTNCYESGLNTAVSDKQITESPIDQNEHQNTAKIWRKTPTMKT